MIPDGIEILDDWLLPEDSQSLFDYSLFQLSTVRQYKLKNGRSRVIRYGWSYETEAKVEIKRLPPWPDKLLPVINSLPHPVDDDLLAITINEYLPGHTICHHIDSERFGEPIQILSLGGEGEMEFKHHNKRHSIILKSGSLLLLSGPVRHLWTHSIKPVKESRVSIVFRELKH